MEFPIFTLMCLDCGGVAYSAFYNPSVGIYSCAGCGKVHNLKYEGVN